MRPSRSASSDTPSHSELFANRDKLRGRHVLELGSGCGLCGLLAAQLGEAVTLTDYNDDVLRNLRLTLQTANQEVRGAAVGTTVSERGDRLRSVCASVR